MTMPLKDKPSFTIVIPTYKGHPLLKKSLSLYKNLVTDYDCEVIIVDDGSPDPLQIPSHPSLITILNKENKGVSFARNCGMRKAKSSIVLFIDDDVKPEIETIIKSVETFKKSKAQAFSCLHSKFYAKDNFATRFKSRYMHETFKKAKRPYSFLYGSFCGFKKNDRNVWPLHLHYGEDTYLGTQIRNRGHIIDFYKDLEFDHYKTYSLLGLLKNDFIIPYHFATSYLISRHKKINFSHTNTDQIYAIASLPLFPLTFLFWIYFNRKVFKEYPNENKMMLIIFVFIDQLVMGLGIFLGLITATYNLLKSDKYRGLND